MSMFTQKLEIEEVSGSLHTRPHFRLMRKHPTELIPMIRTFGDSYDELEELKTIKSLIEDRAQLMEERREAHRKVCA